MGTAIGLTPVLPWISQNNLASGLVLVKGKGDLFWLWQYVRTIEQRELLLKATEGSLSSSM